MTQESVCHDEIKEKVKSLPRNPGVYLMKNKVNKIIYVGKAKDLRARVRSYFNKSSQKSIKTLYLVNQINDIEYILTNTEVEAFLLEASLIKKHRPRYNIRLKDDKAYPYIRCSSEVIYPRFYLCRKVKRDGALYFGPYTSGLAVRETIRFLNQTFKIRDCTDAFLASRKRPCMTYQIGRCTAPCVDLISAEDYRGDIESALEFLRGHDQKVVRSLTRKMKAAAKEERFEAAAKLRDSIQAVKAIWEKQSVINPGADKDQDVVAFFADPAGTLIETLHVRSGRVIGSRPHFLAKLNAHSPEETEKEWLVSFLNQYYMDNVIPDEIVLSVDLGGDLVKLLQAVFEERSGKRPQILRAQSPAELKLMELALSNAQSHFKDHMKKREGLIHGLEEIQRRLKLPQFPTRMECFDISNFQGSQSVASQVVFEEGVAKKEDYRRYKIQSVSGPDDFASMKEALSRRFQHSEYEDPQLLVIDGGKGQLKMAVEALKEVGRPEIPVVGMAKARTHGEFSDPEVSSSEERFFLPGRQNPVTFRRSTEALRILVSLRDEAHRFAITFHRRWREKQTLSSQLDQIKGLGEKRKKILLRHFGSVQAIREASASDIAQLPTFHLKLAEQVIASLLKQ